MLPRTIDEVIQALTTAIAVARSENDRRGYFAGLYLNVTKRVRQALADGDFKHPDLLEKLDVVFANRYLAALQASRSGGQVTASWSASFACDQGYWPVIVQHLLVACNAHIDLDLGVAVAEVVPAAQLPAFKSDFDQINAILASVLNLLNADLVRIWPFYGLCLKVFGKVEDVLVNLGMDVARNAAWSFATALATMPAERRPVAISARDRDVSVAGHLLWHPPLPLPLLLAPVRLSERGTVASIIDILATPAAAATRSRAPASGAA